MNDDIKKNMQKIINDVEIQQDMKVLKKYAKKSGTRKDPLTQIKIDEDNLKHKAQQAQIDSIPILEGIKKNTDYLKNITVLLHETNANQKQTQELILSILEIAQAKDKEEANNKFKLALNKILKVAETGSNIATLFNFAEAIFDTVNKLF